VNIRFPSRCELDSRGLRPVCLRCAGSSCGYVAVDAVVRLKVIVRLSGDLLEISLNRLLSRSVRFHVVEDGEVDAYTPSGDLVGRPNGSLYWICPTSGDSA
jgi:hypothetical protein